MTSKSKGITVFLIAVALIAGVAMTKVGSKYRTQENVNLIFSNVTSNSAKEAGVYFKDLVEEYSDGKMTVDLFPDFLLCIRTITCTTLLISSSTLRKYMMSVSTGKPHRKCFRELIP